MSKAEKEAYNKTYELYDGCCAFIINENGDTCGSPYIHMHHIRYGACGRITYLGNVIPLCSEHHRLVHTNKKKYQPILIDMINKKLEEI
jgi:predicted HNH restriction endonuclease